MSAPVTAIVRCPGCGTKNRVPAVASGVPRCASCHTPLPWFAEADDSRFADVAEKSPLPVLVDVWAPWCGPCRMVTPALEHLAEQHAGEVKLVKVNADHSPRLSQRFSIQAIPTLLVLSGARVVARQVGAAPESRLAQWLADGLRSAAVAGEGSA